MKTKTITGAPPEGKTRRRYPRVAVTGRAFASIGDGQEGSILNMSLGGILLRLKRVLNPGSSYYLKLFLNGKEAVVEARVVHLLIRSGDFLAGMAFVRLSPTDREVLEKFLGPSSAHNLGRRLWICSRARSSCSCFPSRYDLAW